MDKTQFAIGGWILGVVSLFAVLLRQVGPWRKQLTDLEARMREELKSQLDEERKLHLEEMAVRTNERHRMSEQIAKLEKLMSRQQLRHNAERALDRHRLNNINQCFDALILLLKANPEKSTEAIGLIEDMRGKQMLAEAEEKAMIRAAEISADDGECDHDGN